MRSSPASHGLVFDGHLLEPEVWSRVACHGLLGSAVLTKPRQRLVNTDEPSQLILVPVSDFVLLDKLE